MKYEAARAWALTLPEAEEAPHHHMSSFRIRGKIFATVPPEQTHLHVFVSEERREAALAINPSGCEKLWWGKKVVGLRVALAASSEDFVKELLQAAWSSKAPRTLAAKHDL